MPNPTLARVLAGSFLAGQYDLHRIVTLAGEILGHRWRWLRPCAERYLNAFASQTRPRSRDVVHFLQHDAGFQRACVQHADRLSIQHWVQGRQLMQPVPAAATWPIPSLASVGELAGWLALRPAELDWFADLKALPALADSRLSHYHYRFLAKISGSVRLIEIPKPRLKEIQRRILSGILEQIPPHPAAHGFRSGRSIRTFTAPHIHQRVVLRMDLRDFFPSISRSRVQSFFRTAGYPEAVADLLGGLCTNSVPAPLWRNPELAIELAERHSLGSLYARPHLPQGAPTSPALANICAWRLDGRLSGLAQSAGAVYTRYADDLAFSGGPLFERHVDNFSTHVAVLVQEEGFTALHRKTRVMRHGVRQHLAGLTVNLRANLPRADFDRLKAQLTNCLRLGPHTQNRDNHPAFRAHLAGRIAFLASINPAKAQRLRALFDRIQWPR